MSFTPSIHGWPFAPPPTPGPESMGLGAAPVPEGGLGGGLCWAALDRFQLGIRIHRQTPAPEPGQPLHSELVRRQVSAGAGIWSRVADWQERPDGSWRDGVPVRVAGGRDLASLSRAEWPGLRARLDRGEPVLLTLLLPADRYLRSRSARQVLATGWSSSEGRLLVSLYDPTRPDDDDVRLAFGPGGVFDARLTGGQPVRGFFTVPYDRGSRSAVRAETFADRSVIGLNRKVRGAVTAASRGRRLDLVGRSAEGALLHFRRERGRSWEGANVTDQEDLGNMELHSDPVAVMAAGALNAFALSYVGDVLHFRLGRKWSVDNRTEHKRAGPRFRLTGAPVVVPGPWLRISVLGVDKDGGLVHYAGRPITGWRAEQVAGDPLGGAPAAIWLEDDLHVVGTTADHRVLHWVQVGDRWTATDATASPGVSQALRIAGRPVVAAADGVLRIAGRSPEGALAVFLRRADGKWSATRLSEDILGDPIAVTGPAGTHLFARRGNGGLLHAWQDDGWQVEDVLSTRPGLGDVAIDYGLAGWGSDTALRVWGRGDHDLWTLSWSRDADWTAHRLSDHAGVTDRHLPGDDGLVLEDGSGAPHFFCTDGRGTVLHLEPGEWREPELTADVPAKKAAPRATVAPAGARQPAKEAPASTALAEPAGTTQDTELPEAADLTEPAGLAEPSEPSAQTPTAEGEQAPTAESEQAPELPALDSPLGEIPLGDDFDPRGDVAPDESFQWEEEPVEKAPPEIEPMDLGLLDSWPPEPPSARNRKEKERDRKRETS